MRTGFPLNGINDAGRLAPIEDTFHSVTFGVTFSLPVRDRKAGAIEAAVAELDAAKRRREFLELTVRREVGAGYARYSAAARATGIYRVGVRREAGPEPSVLSQTYA